MSKNLLKNIAFCAMAVVMMVSMLGLSTANVEAASRYSYKYTTSVKTTIYKSTKTSSTKKMLWYNTKIKVYTKSAKKTSKGTWKKISYKGKVYYMWVPKGKVLYSKYKRIKTSTYYKGLCTTEYQKAVLTKAFDIYYNWPTKYDFTHKASRGVKDSYGKYPFDCSNFVAYCMEKGMDNCGIPAFITNPDDVGLYNTKVVLDRGLTGEVRMSTICKKNNLDYSKMKPGDLVFFNLSGYGTNTEVNHVGIYIGNKQFIQSTRDIGKTLNKPYGGVCIAPISGMYKDKLVAVKRILPSEKVIPAMQKVVTTKAISYYNNQLCRYGTEDVIGGIGAGTELTVLYTFIRNEGKDNEYQNAWVEFNKNGETVQGFVYKYTECTTHVDDEELEN